MKSYTFVKNIAGQLRISLESYNMQNARQDFVIPAGVEKVIIPYQYALGYFTIEDIDSLIEEATSYGLVADASQKVLSIKELAMLLQNNDVAKIEALIKRENPVETANLFTLVRENYDKIPSGVLSKIETLCGVELKIDE